MPKDNAPKSDELSKADKTSAIFVFVLFVLAACGVYGLLTTFVFN